ncbi:MAG: hypothetical protein IJI48_03035 [Ruminococcus sp.]|nr:hypothetical protein [Ruminococcus sp.]
MKKLISGLSALLTAAMLIAPMSAFADTTVSPTGGDPFDVTPKPGTAGTTVEFSVDPAYTVTIPATVTLEDNGEGIYTNSGTLKAEGVKLAEGKEIVVSLTSASKFNMQTSATAEYKLPYTAEGAFGKLTDKEAGGIVAKFATSTTVQNTPVTFTTDETPKYAGTYTDPVVFTIKVVDITTTAGD